MAATDPALNWSDLDRKAVDTVRVLAMDAVEKAGNGHPGTAMSLAPAAYLLFNRVMRHDPTDPHWPGRDRFVLSCGHSSLTLYIQLYLSGYGLALDDLASLRQWGSLTPGHPEYGHTPGVEVTTGPLGQGIGNAVGMAMAARRERGLFDPDADPGSRPFDHHIYALCSDGDIEEGVSHEVQLDRRAPEAGQPHADLRRQRDLHRGRHPHRQVRGRRRPLRGVRLARPARRLAQGRPGQGRLPRGRRGAVRGDPGRPDGDRQAVLHHPAHDHRLAGAEQAEHRQGARLGARRRRGRGDQADPRLRPRTRRSRSTRTCSPTPARCPSAAGAAHAAWQERFEAWAQGQRRGRRSCSTGCAARSCPTAGPARCPSSRPTPRASPPGPPPARCSTRSRRCCRSCGAARPTSPRATTPR